MDKLISVIIPVYNTGDLLAPCLNSLLNQTYRNLDIWLIDDGSNPETAALCDNWADMDKQRVTVIHKPNGGVSSARNEGIRHAKGDYIMFVDADDWLDLNGIEKMADRIASTNADVCFCNKYFKNETCIQISTTLTSDGIIDAGEIVKLHLHYGFVVSPWLSLSRIDRIKNLLFYEEIHTLEDWEYNFRMLTCMEKVTILSSPYYHYRTVEGSASVSPLNERKMTCFKIPQLVNSYIESKHLSFIEDAKYVPVFLLYHMLVCYSVHGCASDENKQLKRMARKIMPYALTSCNVDIKHKIYMAIACISPDLFKLLYNHKNRRLYVR